MAAIVVTAEQMRALDQATIVAHGVPSMVLMERAALAVVDVLRGGGFDLSRVVVVCGPGNNGGDGMAVARLLHLAGVSVTAVLLGDDDRRSDGMRQQVAIANSYGVPVARMAELADARPTTVVDAIFGIGGARAPAGEFLDAVKYVNLCRDQGAKTLAVDIPSGVATDTGEVPGDAVDADVTVTFAYSKVGLTMSPGRELAGRVFVKDIGIYA